MIPVILLSLLASNPVPAVYMWQGFDAGGDPYFVVNHDGPSSLGFDDSCCPADPLGYQSIWTWSTTPDGSLVQVNWDPHLIPFELPATDFQPGGIYYPWTVDVSDMDQDWRCWPDADSCVCLGDITNDGWVYLDDLLELLSSWGRTVDANNPRADLNGDSWIDQWDMILLLGVWDRRTCS